MTSPTPPVPDHSRDEIVRRRARIREQTARVARLVEEAPDAAEFYEAWGMPNTE